MLNDLLDTPEPYLDDKILELLKKGSDKNVIFIKDSYAAADIAKLVVYGEGFSLCLRKNGEAITDFQEGRDLLEERLDIMVKNLLNAIIFQKGHAYKHLSDYGHPSKRDPVSLARILKCQFASDPGLFVLMKDWIESSKVR